MFQLYGTHPAELDARACERESRTERRIADTLEQIRESQQEFSELVVGPLVDDPACDEVLHAIYRNPTPENVSALCELMNRKAQSIAERRAMR